MPCGPALGELPAGADAPPAEPAKPAKPAKRSPAKRRSRAAPSPPPDTLDEAAVLVRCPDSNAVAASKKTAKLESWSRLGIQGQLIWGECEGSRSYNVAADLGRLYTRCNCPSRKQPCKHGVALMLLFVRGELDAGSPPGWARAQFPKL